MQAKLRTVGLWLAIAGVAAVSGCGDSDSGAQEGAQPAEVRLGDADPASGVYVAEGGGSLRSGATRFTLSNSSQEERGAQLVRIEGDHSVSDAFTAVNEARQEGAPMPAWLRWAGGIVVIRPQTEGSFTADLGPGRYYVLDGSYEGEPSELSELEETARLEVTQGEDRAALPTPPDTITATEYGFQTRGLTAGPNTVLFDNRGAEPHDVALAPIVEGKTLDDVEAFAIGDEESGPPPVDFDNQVISGVLEGGGRQTMQLDLEPGRYALLCFISDRAGGPPHVAMGMLDEVTVR